MGTAAAPSASSARRTWQTRWCAARPTAAATWQQPSRVRGGVQRSNKTPSAGVWLLCGGLQCRMLSLAAQHVQATAAATVFVCCSPAEAYFRLDVMLDSEEGKAELRR